MTEHQYDWIVIGSGAAGIAIAEMLSRSGLTVLLVEKNTTLASGTTKIFHEWLHTGTLYTLVPDRLKTTRYLLGAIDDLFEFYRFHPRMNLIGTEVGLKVDGSGWFNNINIWYRYKCRFINPLWSAAVARSTWLIEDVKSHDWLRRRAGSLYGGFKFDLKRLVAHYPTKLLGFTEVESPDVTINSRVLLTDLLRSFEGNGGEVALGVEVDKIAKSEGGVDVLSTAGKFRAHNVAICCADGISRFVSKELKISYAPMLVVDGLSEKAKSFVELDYYTKRCINLINKGDGIGLAGGISVSRQVDIKEYLNYCQKMHSLRNPSIRVVDSYVGIKKELVAEREDRNYLYHINQVSDNVWGVVLGKFSLMFSLAPEFYRRVYHRNPPQMSKGGDLEFRGKHPCLSDIEWVDIVLKKGVRDGNDKGANFGSQKI